MITSIGKAAIVAMIFADTALSVPLNHCSNAFDTSDIVLNTTNVRYTVTVIPMRDPALSIHSSNILKQSQATSSSSAAPADTIQSEKLAAVSAFKARVSSVQDAAESSGYDSSYFHSSPCSEHSPCTGDLTFYETAMSASSPSACNTINDGGKNFVLALPRGIMAESDCGKTVHIEYGGKSYTGTVVDKCMGCNNQSIDLSRALFQEFASLDEGRLSGATWYRVE